MYSYYQIHSLNINKTNGGSSLEDGVTADVKSNIMTWHPRHASKRLSGIEIFLKARPKASPNGLISSFLVMLTTIGIIGILVGIKCSHIMKLKTPTLTLASKGDTTLMSSSEGVADCMLLSSEGDSTYVPSQHWW